MLHLRPHRSLLPPLRHFRFRFHRFLLLQFPVRPRQAVDQKGARPRPWLPGSRVCHWTALPPRPGHCKRDFNNKEEAHPEKTHGCDTDDHTQERICSEI